MPKRPVRCYHAAPISVRESIRRNGLIPGTWASYGHPGVYLYTLEMIAQHYRTEDVMDIWRVDTRGLTLHVDPEDPGCAVYATIPIAADRVTWIGTYHEGARVTTHNPHHPIGAPRS